MSCVVGPGAWLVSASAAANRFRGEWRDGLTLCIECFSLKVFLSSLEIKHWGIITATRESASHFGERMHHLSVAKDSEHVRRATIGQ